ncbi:MAG: hypothetical protein RSC76_03270 [Oscillospiraceae bacterium]
MKYGIYGFGKSPENLKGLKNTDRITSNWNKLAANFAVQERMDFFYCSPAFLREDPDSDFCIDASGKPHKDYACPNSDRTLEHTGRKILEIAKNPLVSGVTIDGGRFPSLVCSAGWEPFFSCFCPRCMAKMEEQGIDSRLLRHNIAALAHYLHAPNSRDPEELERFRPFISPWLAFREQSVTAYTNALCQNLKACGKPVGGFVFPPSLTRLVGQNCVELAYTFISPMLYRHYQEAYGPACLDKEMIAWYEMTAKLSEEQRLTMASLFSLPTDLFLGEERLRRQGYPPEIIFSELQTAKYRTKKPLVPIILLEDERLEESIAAALSAGVKNLDFFQYQEGLPGIALL